MATSAIIRLRISLLDPLTPLANVLELKLPGKSLPVLSGVIVIAPPIEDVINESLEENGFGPIKSCTDLVAQQSLLSDI